MPEGKKTRAVYPFCSLIVSLSGLGVLPSPDICCTRTNQPVLVCGPSVGGVLESPTAFSDAAGRFAEAGITDIVVHWPRRSEPYSGKVEILEKVAEDLDRHRNT